MLVIAKNIIPDMSSDFEEMNDEELKIVFKNIVEEAQKGENSKFIRIPYLELHPFEVKLNARK